MEVQRQPAHPRAVKPDPLGQRLHARVRNMNHQIDRQTTNAKRLQLPSRTERVCATPWFKRSRQPIPIPQAASGTVSTC